MGPLVPVLAEILSDHLQGCFQAPLSCGSLLSNSPMWSPRISDGQRCRGQDMEACHLASAHPQRTHWSWMGTA